jgi:phosphate transport system substrate-binding protein
MYKFSKVILVAVVSFLLVMCKQNEESQNNKETILKGSTTIYVDETLTPIVEDQVLVFENKYEAKIKIVSKSETETINSLLKEKSAIAILTRNLTVVENQIFEQKKITPKITKFAIDAVAFISNKSTKDTLIALKDVVEFMKGSPNPQIKGLVFDNPNSSTVRYMNDLVGIKSIPKSGVFSFKTNEEVIKFVSENEGMIGIVGVNWLSQPNPKMRAFINNINVLSVKGLSGNDYFFPSQNNLAEEKYPLARDLYIINGQGSAGLGMGFARFVAGDIGQRIILKSGLLPVRIPGRQLKIRTGIDNNIK